MSRPERLNRADLRHVASLILTITGLPVAVICLLFASDVATAFTGAGVGIAMIAAAGALLTPDMW